MLKKVLRYLLGRERSEFRVINAAGRRIRYQVTSRGLYEYLERLMKSREMKSRVVERSIYTMRMYVLGFAYGDGSVFKRTLRISNTDLENMKYIINNRISRILNKLGIDSRAERTQVSKRPDIRCFYRGLIIGIESSYNK